MLDMANEGNPAVDVPSIPQEDKNVGAGALSDGGDGQLRLLLIDDSEDDIFLTRRAFKSSAPHITVQAAMLGEEGVSLAAGRDFDVVVLDYKLPDMTGMEVLERLAGGAPVIMVTGRGDEKLAVQALKTGAADYLVKDEGYLRRLPQAVLGAVARSRLNVENRRLVAQTVRQASLLEAVLNTDPGGIVVLRGPALRVELANSAFRNLAPGFAALDPIGKSVDEVFPRELYSDEVRACLEATLRSGKPHHVQDAEFRPASGGMRYFHLHMIPLNWESTVESGERGVAVILWETTEEVRSRQRIEEFARQAEAQNAWLQAVIDQLPEGVYIASASEVDVVLVNRAAIEILGPPPSANLAAEDTPERFSLSKPDGSPIAVDELPLLRAIRKGEYVVGEQMRHTRADASIIDLLVSASPLNDAQGKLVGGVVAFQDITGIKDLERLKDEFISIASHELRTPLTSIKATAQIMIRRAERNGSLLPQEVSSLNTIIHQSHRMARLIDEMLDVARLQTGRIQIQPTRFDLSALAQEVVESSRISNPEFNFDLHTESLVGVEADQDRIAQVLGNLLENAVKYGHAGGKVSVSVTRTKDGATEFTVSDNGLGFDPSNSEAIFERFSRLGSVANHSKGMGLGLYISRQIVAAHGGTITAHSDGPGRGATFHVTLPTSPAS